MIVDLAILKPLSYHVGLLVYQMYEGKNRV